MVHGSVASDFWASGILREAVSNDATSRRQCDIRVVVCTDYRFGDGLISLLL